MTSYRDKIRTLEETKTVCQRLKEEGKQIVLTNGCFDILHPGHTRYLASARTLGDFLMVAVNSDRSAAQIKGPKRPILSENVRTEILAAFSFVDSVFIFDEDNPLRVIEYLIPDILVKGGDWEESEIIGAGVVKANGGKVIRIPFEGGFSTTAIIEKIIQHYA
ncbi:MAG: D-glycero-beta-D-manno-heptose 1-phosphate adenylyltransferase [Deltaproteobacteria bacterium]|nr:D-glycero-beta-D-manno-heptose 1-phosphate adenylyltransferase [Deltaproteobacteria bacterium]